MDAPTELNAHLGYRLRQLSNHVSHAFARKIARENVTVAEWSLMRVLYGEDPMAPSMIAETMGMTRGAISKLTERLCAKGMIERDARTDDARSHRIKLTQHGKTLVPRLAAIADQNELEWLATLSASEQRDLRALVEKAVVAIDIAVVPTD